MDERKYENLCYDEDDESEISLLDILLILAEGKKTILSFFLIFLLAGLIYGVFIKKPEYASSMQIAAITQESPKIGDFNIYVSGNFISGILESDSVLDSVIDKNDLITKDDGSSNTRINARKDLKKIIDTKVDDKSGIVDVTVKDRNPAKALKVAKSLYDSSLIIMQDMGMLISGQKDAYIQSEIAKSISKIQRYKEEANNTAVNKDIDELLKTLSLFTIYEEGSVYRKSAPMVVQLISPPTLPDEPLPQGRGKVAALSGLLGLFLGLTLVFIKHFWQVSATDPETEEKVKRLKELVCIRKKPAK